MKEKIEIRNFGPIRHIIIEDIKPLTVFVGESGSGKSTIMKVLALFRWIYKMVGIRSYLKDYSRIKKSPFRFNFPSYLKLDGLNNLITTDTYLYYSRGECKMEYSKSKFRLINQQIPKDELSLEKIAFISEKRNLIPEILDHGLSVNKKAFYLNEVWYDYLNASEHISELEMPFTNVKFIKRKTKLGERHSIQSMESSNNYTIDLNESSSGIQSSTPLSLIVEYFSRHYDLIKAMNKSVLSYLSEQDIFKEFHSDMNIGDFPSKRVNLFVEEPELCLFPDNQTGLLDFIVHNCFNSRTNAYDITLMLSTHSPYITNYLNVLLHRTQDHSHINKDQLAVYRIFDGEIQDLIVHSDENDGVFVDTRDLTETMQDIYDEYVGLKEGRQ